VRQGGVSSPILYTLFISPLIEELRRRGLGVRLTTSSGRVLLPGTLWADDILLLARSPEELQEMLDVVCEFALSWRFDLNSAKTKTMVLGRQDLEDYGFNFDGEPLEKTDTFKYLGIDFQDGRHSWHAHASRVLVKARGRLFSMYSTVQGERFSVSTGARLWKMCVLPIFAYGSEVWYPTKSDGESMDALQRRWGRQLLGLNRHANNAFVMGEFGWLPVTATLTYRRLCYIGRLLQLPDTRLIKQYFLQRRATVDDQQSYSWWSITNQLAQTYKIELVKANSLPLHEWKRYVFKAIQTEVQRKWNEEANRSSRLKRYYRIKKTCGEERYLLAPDSRSVRWWAKLRSSCNSLEVDLGRQSKDLVPRHERVCTICTSSEVGDEDHFMFHCSALDIERDVLFASLEHNLSVRGFNHVWKDFRRMDLTDKGDVLLGGRGGPAWPNAARNILHDTARRGLYRMFQRRKEKLHDNFVYI
jgi:hypothetical protein